MQAKSPQADGPGDQSAEIARLRREVERLRMERNILKKCGYPRATTSLTDFADIESGAFGNGDNFKADIAMSITARHGKMV